MILPSYSDLNIAADAEKMTKVNLFVSDRMFVDYYLLEPGQQQKPHTHDANDKLYYVLSGRGMFLIGDVEHELSSGQGCVAAATVVHGVRNHGDERLVLLVSMAPHPGRKG